MFLFTTCDVSRCRTVPYRVLSGPFTGLSFARSTHMGGWGWCWGFPQAHDVVYVMGTYDSPCERHLYALPLTNPVGGPKGSTKPVRLTQTPCMHNVIMDHRLRRCVTLLVSFFQECTHDLFVFGRGGGGEPTWKFKVVFFFFFFFAACTTVWRETVIMLL